MSQRRALALVPVIVALLVSCSSDDTGAIQTAIASSAQTAAAQGAALAKTEAAQLQQTAQVVVATEAAGIKETVVGAVATQVAGPVVNTPSPPYEPSLATYTAVRGDTVSEIAKRFSISAGQLVDLNRHRYPSLVTNPDYLEVGWVLIVSAAPAVVPTPLPTPRPTPWSSTPGCDVAGVYWLTPPIECRESTLKVASKVGFSIGCIVLDGNPLGYYIEDKIYQGWILIDANGVWSYGWFQDVEKHTTEIGPAIILDTSTLVRCGIPGNP